MENDVLGFDVSMDDSVGMDFSNRVTDLSHETGYLFFRHGCLFFELMEKLSSGSNFHDEVYCLGVIEESEKFHDISMVEKHLYFDLSDKLLGNFLFFQQFLLNTF